MKRFFVAVCLTLLTVNAYATTLTSNTMPAQAKVEVARGKIKSSDTFKCILKVQANSTTDVAANTSASTSTLGSYNTTGELAGTGGYTQGGVTLGSCAVTLSTQTANFSCSNPSWTNTAALTFDLVEIYDSSCGTNSCDNANQVVGLYPVTSFTSATSGTITLTLPSNLLSWQ